jgi:hypothetical protein
MATIVGDAILLIVGNPDVLKVLSVFGITVSVLLAVIFMWKHVEEWRS